MSDEVERRVEEALERARACGRKIAIVDVTDLPEAVACAQLDRDTTQAVRRLATVERALRSAIHLAELLDGRGAPGAAAQWARAQALRVEAQALRRQLAEGT